MRAPVRAHLVNGLRGDPALYVDFEFQRRALLFDLGDVTTLAPRRILRLTDVFVSHPHMDHFIGLDHLVRVLLGRERLLRLYGPPGIIGLVAHRLRGYAWNLVGNYAEPLVLEVLETDAAGPLRRARFHAGEGFPREDLPELPCVGGVLRDEPAFRVRTVLLDHRIPCLAFAFEEKRRLNVWKSQLDAQGLPTGPWLDRLKTQVRAGAPDGTPVEIAWRDAHGPQRSVRTLGSLRATVLREAPGFKLAYVVDAAFHDDNRGRIVALARDADVLYVEAPFLNEAAERAAVTAHLTAGQAGQLAREAAVKRVEPFHFSPRHAGEDERIRAEVLAAFAGR